MSKRTRAFDIDPPVIDLEDCPASIVVDPDNGNILITEGGGDDRMNSAYLPARKSPRFSVTPGSAEHRLEVHCRNFHWLVGTTADADAARQWAEAANAILAAFDAPATPETPTPNESDERRPVAAPAVLDSSKHA